MDRGPVEFKTRLSDQESEIIRIAGKDVVTIPRTITIIGAAKTMTNYGFRRLPVTNPGNNKLEGILTSMDIVRFMGGGESFKLIKNGHYGNFLSAINESVNQIMESKVISVDEKGSLEDAVNKMVSSGIGGIPIVDNENRVKGIITERDIVSLISKIDIVKGIKVKDIMTKKVITIPPDSSIMNLTTTMVEQGFRRLPIIEDGILVGIVTATDVLRYLGNGGVFDKLVTGDINEVLDVPVSEIMVSDVETGNSQDPLTDIAKTMANENIGSIPIIDNNNLEGIVTENDLVRSIIEVQE
ncbi:CBS domain-containing protein [Methanonatronarchaeum sp. AMET-Sl]|uniref:CBS domain-containing protein n=1 Tax=Methanonatronarchaeum sp. AMET-Sl TaxID=3037654 RepID=UPI00244E3949|nr:CBS domain-containing protein [Methanonatronarchaeum sp. AMET-Sl]WGI17047.1 CBS domain-containing protein [Methanonatronarchaeum sp. AMET-Sl]